MSRRFLRPLFSFWDPFFTEPLVIRRVIPNAQRANRGYNIQERKTENDPHETFDNFFKDYYENTSALKAEEKQFFEKHYPEKVGKKFNAYQVLGLQNNADIEKIKQAYRVNALKYHPKNDSTPEGQKKFNEISRAYNQLLTKKQTDEYGQDVSTKSLFQDFHKQMQNFSKLQAKQQTKQKVEQNKTNMKAEQKVSAENKTGQSKNESKSQTKPNQKDKKVETNDKKQKNDILKGAELYSQSSYFQYINGKRKLHVTKMYQKDGKTIKVDRVQQNRNDGSVEVTQTFDDGKEVRNKKFIQGANKKQRYIGN